MPNCGTITYKEKNYQTKKIDNKKGKEWKTDTIV